MNAAIDSGNKNYGMLRLFVVMTELMLCISTLYIIRSQMSESIRCTLYVLCVVSTWDVKGNVSFASKELSTLWKRIVAVIVCIYATISITGLYLIPSTVEYLTSIGKPLFFLMSFIWVSNVMIWLMRQVLERDFCRNPKGERLSLRKKLCVVILIMIPCVICQVAFNPAITTADSVYCLDTARKIWSPEVSMKDWQPPFYVFLLSLTIHIADTEIFFTVLQYVFYAVVLVEGIDFLHRYGLSKKVIGFVGAFIVLAPNNLVQTVTFIKDTPYAVALLWLTIVMMKYALDTECGSSLWWHVEFVISIILVGFLRQNGILPAIAVLLLFVIRMRKDRRVWISFVTCLVLMALVKGSLYSAMGVYKVPPKKYMAMAQDILFVYDLKHNMGYDELVMVTAVANGNDEVEGFSDLKIMKRYVSNMVNHPYLTSLSIMRRSGERLFLTKPADQEDYLVNYLLAVNPEDNPVFMKRQSNHLTGWLNATWGGG